MTKLLCDDARRLAPARNPSQFIARRIVPQKRGLIRGNFQHFLRLREPVDATGVCYRGTARQDKMQVSIRFPLKRHRREIFT
jgi:hypothetical protein